MSKSLADECTQRLADGEPEVTLGGRQGPYKETEADMALDPTCTEKGISHRLGDIKGGYED